METMTQGVPKSKISRYNPNIEGQFIVHLAKKLSSDDDRSIPHLHPANSSKILWKNSVNEVEYIAWLGRNIIQVVFTSFRDANSLIANFPPNLRDK